MQDWIMKLKPGLPKVWLHFTAGVVWTCVGLYLISLTRNWVVPKSRSVVLLIILAGILLALVIYSFGFSMLANKNINRIDSITNKNPCIFAFQEWTSYPLVIVMISLGIFLRVYSPIPKSYLAVMYFGIGFSLFLASLHYYKHLWKTELNKMSQNIRGHS